ncbi:MAG: hypothetical protein M3520_14420 [Actinomycetota bacterium]|nr:hypothetical protein [Actinomycetota bacterium]
MTRYLLLMAEADHYAKWEAADDALRERVYADFEAFSASNHRFGWVLRRG